MLDRQGQARSARSGKVSKVRQARTNERQLRLKCHPARAATPTFLLTSSMSRFCFMLDLSKPCCPAQQRFRRLSSHETIADAQLMLREKRNNKNKNNVTVVSIYGRRLAN